MFGYSVISQWLHGFCDFVWFIRTMLAGFRFIAYLSNTLSVEPGYRTVFIGPSFKSG